MNAEIPDPNWKFQTLALLYKAGLTDFWGINPNLFDMLHKEYNSPVVKFWLLGELYMSFSDIDDITEINKLAKGRPKLTELILPFLGGKNLLFQPTGHGGGFFVKQLRLRYHAMVSSRAALDLAHEQTRIILEGRTRHWADLNTTVDVFEELKTIMYDIMGVTLFDQCRPVLTLVYVF